MPEGTSTLGSQIMKAYTLAKESAGKPGMNAPSANNSFGSILKDMVQDQVTDTISSIKASEKTNPEKPKVSRSKFLVTFSDNEVGKPLSNRRT